MRFHRLGAVLAATALVLGACTGGSSGVQTETQLLGEYRDEPTGSTMDYLVWFPDGYGDDRSVEHPLIVFLHGSGSVEYNPQFVMSFGLPAVLQTGEQPPDFDFVVVSPVAAPGTAWWTDGQLDMLDRFVQEVTDTYLVDAERVYLTGLSMGGYGSWFLATSHPERFAAVASLSGSGYQALTLPPSDYTCNLAEVPVWGIHGERDLIAPYVPVEAVVRQYEAMCETRVKWTSYPDAGHFETYERAYRDPELYRWFLDHRR